MELDMEWQDMAWGRCKYPHSQVQRYYKRSDKDVRGTTVPSGNSQKKGIMKSIVRKKTRHQPNPTRSNFTDLDEWEKFLDFPSNPVDFGKQSLCNSFDTWANYVSAPHSRNKRKPAAYFLSYANANPDYPGRSRASLLELPVDSLCSIMQFLDFFFFISLRVLCKKWNKASDNPALYYHFFIQTQTMMAISCKLDDSLWSELEVPYEEFLQRNPQMIDPLEGEPNTSDTTTQSGSDSTHRASESEDSIGRKKHNSVPKKKRRGSSSGRRRSYRSSQPPTRRSVNNTNLEDPLELTASNDDSSGPPKSSDTTTVSLPSAEGGGGSSITLTCLVEEGAATTAPSTTNTPTNTLTNAASQAVTAAATGDKLTYEDAEHGIATSASEVVKVEEKDASSAASSLSATPTASNSAASQADANPKEPKLGDTVTITTTGPDEPHSPVSTVASHNTDTETPPREPVVEVIITTSGNETTTTTTTATTTTTTPTTATTTTTTTTTTMTAAMESAMKSAAAAQAAAAEEAMAASNSDPNNLTLNKLIGYCTSASVTIEGLMDRECFSTEYPIFSNTSVILLKLIQRYYTPFPASYDVHYKEQWEKQELQPMKKYVVNILINLFREYSELMKREEKKLYFTFVLSLPKQIQNSFVNAMPKPVPVVVPQGISLLGTPPSETNAKQLEELFSLAPETVAERLTMIEFELWKRLRLYEFHKEAWNKNQEQAKNLKGIINRFNALANWVQHAVVTAPKLRTRVKRISFLIRVAEHCSNLHNFQSTNGIVQALEDIMYRLTISSSEVPAKDKALLAHLLGIFDPTGSNRQYRIEFAKIPANTPKIPYPGVHLRDCIYNETGLVTAGLINCKKVCLLWNTMLMIRGIASCPYNFDANDKVDAVVCPLAALPKETLQELARATEPKGATKADIP